jgi:5,10-methylenetetrahydrofolate reductase
MESNTQNLKARLKLPLNKIPICLEVNPPRGCDAAAIFEKLDAEDLNHIDLFNVTDCALAKLKLHAATFAACLKQKYSKEVVVNLSCRDRNLLGLESELLGASFAGIGGVVAITGDAMSVGDNADRKGVFEVNSVRLMETITKFNQGSDAEGRPLKGATKLLICGVANPHSTNQGVELKRLKKKKDAGASLILTQPVFDAPSTKDFFIQARDLGLEMMAGLLAFKTPTTAMHGLAVPGVKVPVDKYKDLAPDADISEQTINECLAIAESLKDVVSGFHIITGGNMTLSMKLVRRLSEALR